MTKHIDESRSAAAPRRRFRSEDDAGFLGDSPILLNLPSLCGVPDTAPKSPRGGFADLLGLEGEQEPEPDPLGDVAGPETPASDGEESHVTASLAERDADESSLAAPPSLATPEFTESNAAAESASVRDQVDVTDDDEFDEEFDPEEEDGYSADPSSPPASSGHRKIIIGLSLFVICAALWMYSNHKNRTQGPDVETPTVNIDMGYDDLFADDAGEVGPSYAEDYGPTGDSIESPELAAPELSSGDSAPSSLPPLNAAADADTFQIQQIGSVEGSYPQTSTPEAAYVVDGANTVDDGTRVGMQPSTTESN